MTHISTRIFPRAILHFDGDAFFASVEQMMDFRLRGKPVVTGGERGAATSLSYEAKARGLHRGMTMREIKMRCPEVIIVPSDYTAYGIYARRMYAIVRTYVSEVEEYSIDECFADITGLEETFHMPYEDIALLIKDDLESSLGITFGVGLAPTKTIAKIASKAHKPAGFTPIGMTELGQFLTDTPIHEVWGFGGASGTKLQKLGVMTAFDFIQKEEWWLSLHSLGKAYRDIWLELRGASVKHVLQGENLAVGSLMRTRTFSPPSSNRDFILSQLSKNVEDVCEKARRHKVRAKAASFYLKTQEFTYHGVSIEFTVPLASPMEILKIIETRFDEVYAPGILYRASGITLRGFVSNDRTASDLFGECLQVEKQSKIMSVVDGVNKKYGRHTLTLGSSLAALSKDKTKKHRLTLSLDRKKKTLYLPFLGSVR